MNEIQIIDTPSLYRDDFRIKGFTFGHGKKSVCVVGPMRGNEFQQQFITARLVHRLEKIEAAGELKDGVSILVIPCVNNYSFNTQKRFWSIDNSDINRSFPGVVHEAAKGGEEGTTTERIAKTLIETTKDYEFGIQIASSYIAGTFSPHIRILKTQMEYIDDAKKFKMPYIQLREAHAMEKTTLNYNWQLNGVKAFALYSSSTNYIDRTSAHTAMRSVLLFLKSLDIITTDIPGGYESIVLNETDLISVHAPNAGFFVPKVTVGFEVAEGDVLAEIRDPYTNKVVSKIASPCAATVFYMHSEPITYSHTVVFNLIVK